MTQLSGAIPFLTAFLFLTLAVTPASAAKGVKKTGQHLSRGTVTAIHKHKNTETVTILTRHHKKKQGLQRSAGTRLVPQTYTVDTQTQVSGGKLQQGKHVSIAAHGQHADTINIQHPTQKQRRRTPTLARHTTHHTPVHHTTAPPAARAQPHPANVQHHANMQRPAATQQHRPAQHAPAPARRKNANQLNEREPRKDESTKM